MKARPSRGSQPLGPRLKSRIRTRETQGTSPGCSHCTCAGRGTCSSQNPRTQTQNRNNLGHQPRKLPLHIRREGDQPEPISRRKLSRDRRKRQRQRQQHRYGRRRPRGRQPARGRRGSKEDPGCRLAPAFPHFSLLTRLLITLRRMKEIKEYSKGAHRWNIEISFLNNYN